MGADKDGSVDIKRLAQEAGIGSMEFLDDPAGEYDFAPELVLKNVTEGPTLQPPD